MSMFSHIDNAIFLNQTYLAAVGFVSCVIVLCFVSAKLCRAIHVFVLPRLNPPDFAYFGKWAVVTGGSSGIGRSYAHRLASGGMNIAIISNEKEALKLTAQEIEAKYNVQCCYIYADFTKSVDVFDQVMMELSGKDVGVLVNSAGIAGNTPCRFLKETEKNVLAMIDLHIRAIVNMNLKILPSMLKKNKGVIVNISSMASLDPMAFYAIYSSSKAFSDYFTRSLHWEYSNSYESIYLQSLAPCYISTRMVKASKLSLVIKRMAMDCDRFTDSAVRTIGTTYHTCGYWTHELMWFIYLLCPNIIAKKIKFYHSLN